MFFSFLFFSLFVRSWPGIHLVHIVIAMVRWLTEADFAGLVRLFGMNGDFCEQNGREKKSNYKRELIELHFYVLPFLKRIHFLWPRFFTLSGKARRVPKVGSSRPIAGRGSFLRRLAGLANRGTQDLRALSSSDFSRISENPEMASASDFSARSPQHLLGQCDTRGGEDLRGLVSGVQPKCCQHGGLKKVSCKEFRYARGQTHDQDEGSQHSTDVGGS